MGAEVARWKLLTLATALILTLSRSSVLGFLAGSVLILAVRGLSKRVARLAVAGMLLLIPLLPFILSYANQFNKLALDASALTRVIAWLHALQILADHPIIGIGFNTFGFVQDLYGYRMVGRAAFALDGGLLFVAVLTGLVGLTFYIVMIGLVVARCRGIWKDPTRPPEDCGLALGVAAATIALVVHSTFLNSLFYPFLMETVWVLWGLTFCMTSTKATESGDRSGAVSQPRVSVVSFPSAPRATSAP
jgi:O-antigen ligase